MSLSERFRAQLDEEQARTDFGVAAAPEVDAPVDPFVLLKDRAQDALVARLGARLYDESLDQSELDELVSRELAEVLDAERTALSVDERQDLVRDICTDVLGLGPIEPYLADPTVTEVMVNGPNRVFIERRGIIELTDARYRSDAHLRRVIDRMVARIGRRVDESSPMVDARLPDGSRVNAIVPPLSVDGPMLTIRKFSRAVLSASDMIETGSLTAELVDVLEACVRGRLNVLVSGGTGSGKTTLLNVLSGFIPETERLVTIEDSVELQLIQDHVIRLESRPQNIEGRGEITIRDLLRNSLRMRPDRIIIGEVRGGEAIDMLQAMNTGHDGSLSTLHANSPRDALSRLETMVLMAGVELPLPAIRKQISAAVDLIVHVSRQRDGSRRVTQVSEVVGQEGDTVTLNDLFVFDTSAGLAPDGSSLATLRSTGVRPRFSAKLAEQGIQLAGSLFGDDGVVRPGAHGGVR